MAFTTDQRPVAQALIALLGFGSLLLYGLSSAGRGMQRGCPVGRDVGWVVDMGVCQNLLLVGGLEHFLFFHTGSKW